MSPLECMTISSSSSYFDLPINSFHLAAHFPEVIYFWSSDNTSSRRQCTFSQRTFSSVSLTKYLRLLGLVNWGSTYLCRVWGRGRLKEWCVISPIGDSLWAGWTLQWRGLSRRSLRLVSTPSLPGAATATGRSGGSLLRPLSSRPLCYAVCRPVLLALVAHWTVKACVMSVKCVTQCAVCRSVVGYALYVLQQ